ncbi:hypothetical protein IC229_15925 [Spirosoma sp. BT702]|uniref:Uncharacterized protein n=1 Tax=Spirosoma profusum TaxID=2771354 RepID=A0A926Y3Q1_9BACT|nr:hypothetical protein [Spirosoma profusum]MBD2702140.1 hypothetical protein [Spirosoma profusum]
METIVKSITPSVVSQAAATLMVAEGGTSTLLVQQFLRNQGYQSYEAEVSKWLNVAAEEAGWAVEDKGLFRVYSFPENRFAA